MPPRVRTATGRFEPSDLGAVGERCVFIEEGVRIWQPQTVRLGADVYLGHAAPAQG